MLSIDITDRQIILVRAVVVYFFNSNGNITGRKLFDAGYKKNGNWYFENETAVYRVVIKVLHSAFGRLCSESYLFPYNVPSRNHKFLPGVGV